MTARRVAARRLSFRRVAADGGRPDDDQRLQGDVAAGLQVSTDPDDRMARYLQARTAFFDRVTVDSIAAGTDQIVVLGAGYDGRSLRYARAGVRWFELDHPDTQADKRARLDRLGIDTTGVAFAAVDFGSDDVAGALRGVGHEPVRPSLFSCEGVAAYLPEEVLSSLLRAARSCAAAGSRLAVEIPLDTRSASEAARRARLQSAVGAMGEALVTAIPRAGLDHFLAATGWVTHRATDPAGVDLAASDRSTAFVVAGLLAPDSGLRAPECS